MKWTLAIVLVCLAHIDILLWAGTPDPYSSPGARIVRRVDGQESIRGFQLPQGSEVTIFRKAVSITFASPVEIGGRVLKGRVPYLFRRDLDFSQVRLDELKPGATVQGFTIPIDAEILVEDSLQEATLSGPFRWEGWEFQPGTHLQFSREKPGHYHVEGPVTYIVEARIPRSQRIGPMSIEFPAGTRLSLSYPAPVTVQEARGPGIIKIAGCPAQNWVQFDAEQRVSFFVAAENCTFRGTKVEKGERVYIDQTGAIRATR